MRSTSHRNLCHHGVYVAILLAVIGATSIKAFSDDPPDFMQAILMNDPTINNSISLLPQWQRSFDARQLTIGAELNKDLGRNIQLTFDSGWGYERALGDGSKNGIVNSQLSLGYVFFQRPEFQTMVIPSISLHSDLGISEPDTAGIAMTGGGRLAMLNESLRVPVALQAVQFDADFGTHLALGTGSNDVFGDAMLVYSLPYLDFATKSAVPLSLKNLEPFFMINYVQQTSGLEASTPHLYYTPGVSYQGDAYQVSAAVQLPLNQSGNESQQIGVTGAVIIYLDKLDPRFGKTILQ